MAGKENARRRERGGREEEDQGSVEGKEDTGENGEVKLGRRGEKRSEDLRQRERK